MKTREPDGLATPPLIADGFAVARHTGAGNTVLRTAYIRRSTGLSHPVLFVLGGPVYIEWFGRHFEPHYDCVYFDPEMLSLLLSRQLECVDAVRRHLDTDAIYLFGHSHNGAVALEYAAAHPTHVAGVIWVAGLNNHPLSLTLDFELLTAKSETAEQREQYASLAARNRYNVLDLCLAQQARKLAPPYRQAEQCRRAFAGVSASTAARQVEKLRKLSGVVAPAPLDVFLAAARVDLRAKSLLDYCTAEIADKLQQVPIVMIQGVHDPVVNPQTSKGLAQALPQAQLLLFENSGHLPFIEEKQRFLAEVVDFLGVPPSPPTRSSLPAGWRPEYDDGATSHAQLTREAHAYFAVNTARKADLALLSYYEVVGQKPSRQLLSRLNISAEQHREVWLRHASRL